MLLDTPSAFGLSSTNRLRFKDFQDVLSKGNKSYLTRYGSCVCCEKGEIKTHMHAYLCILKETQEASRLNYCTAEIKEKLPVEVEGIMFICG